MKKEFWLERWERKEIGFHQDEINLHLRQYWGGLRNAHGCEVFVPLCGKSNDMWWLRQQGHRVLGVELSDIATEAFFAEKGKAPKIERADLFDCYEEDGIRILRGDFFDLKKTDLAGIGAVYDRASLAALPPDMRERYARHLVEILPQGVQILLITFDYLQQEMQGPPFAVAQSEVEGLYGRHAEIHLQAHLDVLVQNPRFQERGLSRLQENIYLLKLR